MCPENLEREICLHGQESFQSIFGPCLHKILQTHLLRAFVANLKIYAIYALYPESFCNKNPAIWKVFAFSDSD